MNAASRLSISRLKHARRHALLAASLTILSSSAIAALAPVTDFVNLNVAGVDLPRFEVADGSYHTELYGTDVAIAVFRKGSQYDLLVANPFPGRGDVGMPRVIVSFPSGTGGAFNPQVLMPGQCLTLSNSTAMLGTGSDLPPVVTFYQSWLGGGSNWWPAGQVSVYGNGDANEGSGSLIYPWIDHWADGPRGRRMAYEIMRGYAHRSLLVRWDYTSFLGGSISPWVPDPGTWEGLDRTRAFVPYGYRRAGDTVGLASGYRIYNNGHLDQAHLGRMTHSTAFMAKQGYPLAKVMLQTLVEDVRLAWCYGGFSDAQLSQSMSPNFVWWTCNDIKSNYPAGTGCLISERSMGQGMMALAAGVEVFPGVYDSDLELMLEAVEHVFDPLQKVVLRFDVIDPVFGQVSNAYQHERASTYHNIPESETPGISKQFHDAIMYCGLRLARKAQTGELTSGVWSYDDLALGVARGLAQFPAELRALDGHHDWSSTLGSLWSPLVLGIPKTRFGQPDEDLWGTANSLSPINSGNFCAAFLGGI